MASTVDWYSGAAYLYVPYVGFSAGIPTGSRGALIAPIQERCEGKNVWGRIVIVVSVVR